MNFHLDVKPDRKVVQTLLAVVAVSLASLFSWELYAGGKGAGAGDDKAVSSEASTVKNSGPITSAGPRPREFYRVVAAKDLFSPGRSQYDSTTPTVVTGEDETSAEGYVLEGVFILGPDRMAILKKTRGKAGGEVIRVKVGEAVDRYRVTHIDEDSLTMVTASGKEKRLSLFSIESVSERSHTKTTQKGPVDPGAFTPSPRPRVPMPGAMPGQVPDRSGNTPNR